jgi:hypothetical protein
MVIEQTNSLEPWERQMMSVCPVESLLAPEPSGCDDRLQIWYNITGKQSLDVVLETEKLNYELLCRIMTALYMTAGRLERLLLDTRGIVLSPKAVYLDGTRENVYFCYYPGSDKSGIDGFESLMESMLPYIDHSDEKCVACAYRIYEEACREGFGLVLLKDLICPIYEREYSETDVTDLCDGDDTEQEVLEDKAIKNDIYNKKSVLEKLKAIRIHFQKKSDDEPFVFEPEYMDTATKNPTVLLGGLNARPEGLLMYEGDGRCADIRLIDGCTLIGNDKELPGFIAGAAVSRHHARIYREGDNYYIEDLNSSNGTYIDGNMLAYRERTELKKNQTVRFANEKYRFI